MGLRRLGIIREAIDHSIRHEVRAQIKRQYASLQSHEAQSLGPRREPDVTELASDEVVRVLMRKLQDLAQEERFLLGRLR